MSVITPQTEVRLLKCPLEEDNLNQMNFSNATAQYNYFNSLPHLTVDNFTYQRKDNIIRYPEHIDNLLGYNYVMYQNEAYTNKWFYAYITNMEYVNDKMTHITIKTDVFQTWQFDLIYKQSFIEREHVNNDTAGAHTVPEGLETGEYICGSSGSLELNDTFSDWSVVMAVTIDKDLFPSIANYYYGGCFSGTVFIEFSGIYIGQAGIFIGLMNQHNKVDEITSIFMYPSFLIDSEPYQITFDGSVQTVVTCGKIASTYEADSFSIPIGTKPTTLGSYTPKNKKLLTSEYSYLLVDNGVGGVKKYNYEDFVIPTEQQGVMFFDCISTITPSGSILYVPDNYKGKNPNMLEGIACGKFPMCSWDSDPYLNWLTQAGVNKTWNIGKDIVGTIGGIGLGALGLASGNPLLAMAGGTMITSGITSGVGDVLEDVKQKQLHDIAPISLQGNESLGDVIFAYQRTIPKYYHMHIKEEYARICDDFFDRYGYKINRVKIPNITGRTNWNYVKTININLEGDIPEKDLQEIKNIFNNGVTIWHNPSTYLDYSQSNAIV